MSKDYYHRIRLRFIAVVISVLLVLGGLFFWQSVRERRIIIASAEKSSASYAAALTEHAGLVFVEVDSSLKELVADIEQQGIPYAASAPFHRLINSRVKNELQFSSIYVLGKDGTLVAHSGEYPVKPRVLDDRTYFRHHRDSPDSSLFISPIHTSALDKTEHFSLSRPLRGRDGRFAGVVTLSVETSYFEQFYKGLAVGSNGRIFLATTDGEILANVPGYDKPVGIDLKSSVLFKEYLPTASSGTRQHVSPISHDLRILSYKKLDGFPVVAVVSLSMDAVLESWYGALRTQGGIAALLCLLACTVSLLFLRQLKQLEAASRKLSMQQDELELKAELLDAATDAILLLDTQGRFVYFNNALQAMSGYSREELEQRGLHGIEPPEYAARIQANIDSLLEHGEAFFESAYLCKSGRILPIEVHARIANVNGRTLVLSMVRDISERKEIERQITSSAQEWQHTFDAVEDSVWLLDMDRQVTRANRASQAIFGKSPQDVLGLHCCDATYGTTVPRTDCPFEIMLATRKRANAQLKLNNKWYEVSVDPIFDEQGTIVRAAYIVKDIDSLKKAEQRELVRSGILERIAGGEPLSRLLSFIALSIEKENPEMLCSILLVSDDGKRLLNGAAPSLPDFYTMATNRTKIGEGIGSCGTAAFQRQRVIVEDIDTHPFWKGFTPAREAGLRSCWSEPIISSSGVLLGTFAIYHRTPAVPVEEELSLIQQASAFAGIAIERSKGEAERMELEHLLSQSQKMEAIGHLSGGIAHDFNNLLTPILIYADMLKRSLPDNEKVQSQLDGIIKASGKARDLTQQLLSFGRKQVMQMQVVDLNDVIMSFHSMVRRMLRENISISLMLSSQPVVVRGDSSKLEQVLLNLVLNAQDAIAVNGSISIETGQVLIDDEFARRHPGMSPGLFVLLSCTDNGCGMNTETLSRIFEPFFSTKEVGHGTGLGLANVYGIVKQHNGNIMAISTIGVGTTFKIYLPVCDEKPLRMEMEKEQGDIDHSGSAVILLVEDNEMVRVMSSDLLEGLGYTVYCAEHPERALELLKEIPKKIDLVITDVVMPGMNGQQLFERIRTEHPEIDKVLYMSGYTNNVIVTDGNLDDGLHFLQKPFTVDALMAKVKELLQPQG
ncbi:MAG: PAS domain S-box protein [Pelobacteraceae bacterium]